MDLPGVEPRGSKTGRSGVGGHGQALAGVQCDFAGDQSACGSVASHSSSSEVLFGTQKPRLHFNQTHATIDSQCVVVGAGVSESVASASASASASVRDGAITMMEVESDGGRTASDGESQVPAEWWDEGRCGELQPHSDECGRDVWTEEDDALERSVGALHVECAHDEVSVMSVSESGSSQCAVCWESAPGLQEVDGGMRGRGSGTLRATEFQPRASER
jgi:hypothetical protein